MLSVIETATAMPYTLAFPTWQHRQATVVSIRVHLFWQHKAASVVCMNVLIMIIAEKTN